MELAKKLPDWVLEFVKPRNRCNQEDEEPCKLFYDRDGVEIGEKFERDCTETFGSCELHKIRRRIFKRTCPVCDRTYVIDSYEEQGSLVIYNPRRRDEGYIYICYECRKKKPNFRELLKKKPRTVKYSLLGWQRVYDI